MCEPMKRMHECGPDAVALCHLVYLCNPLSLAGLTTEHLATAQRLVDNRVLCIFDNAALNFPSTYMHKLYLHRMADKPHPTISNR